MGGVSQPPQLHAASKYSWFLILLIKYKEWWTQNTMRKLNNVRQHIRPDTQGGEPVPIAIRLFPPLLHWKYPGMTLEDDSHTHVLLEPEFPRKRRKISQSLDQHGRS